MLTLPESPQRFPETDQPCMKKPPHLLSRSQKHSRQNPESEANCCVLIYQADYLKYKSASISASSFSQWSSLGSVKHLKTKQQNNYNKKIPKKAIVGWWELRTLQVYAAYVPKWSSTTGIWGQYWGACGNPAFHSAIARPLVLQGVALSIEPAAAQWGNKKEKIKQRQKKKKKFKKEIWRDSTTGLELALHAKPGSVSRTAWWDPKQSKINKN